MKKKTRFISALLVLMIILSSISCSFSAFAEQDDRSEAVQSLEEKLTEFNSVQANLAYAKPTVTVDASNSKYESQVAAVERYEKALSLYNEIVPEFKKLSDAEKDTLDVYTVLRFLQKAITKEAYEIKTAYDNALPAGSTSLDKMSNNESLIKGQEKVDEIIGEHDARTEALEVAKYLWTPVYTNPLTGKETYLGTNLDFSKYDKAAELLAQYTEAYQNMSDLAKQYIDGVNASTHVFALSTMGGKFRDVVKMTVKKQMSLGEVAFNGGTKPPAATGKPNIKNYPEGDKAPEYIKQLNIYLEAKKIEMEYKASEYNWKADVAEAAALDILAKMPEYSELGKTIVLLRDGYEQFNKTNSITIAEQAVSHYDALSAWQKSILSALSVEGYSYIYLSSKGDNYYTSDIAVSKLYDKCVDAKNIIYVEQFIEFIDSVNLDKVDNSVVAAAVEKNNAIPSSVKVNIPSETLAKYEAINALYDPVDPISPSDYDFAKEIASYNNSKPSVLLPDSKYATETGVKSTMDSIEELLYTFLAGNVDGFNKDTGLQGLLKEDVYTNANIGKIFSLYDTIYNSEINAEVMGSTMNVAPLIGGECTPKKVAALIPEVIFSSARTKLEATVSADGKSSTADYANITWYSGDWGFIDGDEEGFKTALTAVLRPVVSMLHNGLLFLDQLICLPNYTESNGDYCYGAYELLLPAFESLGLDMPSSEKYTSDYIAAAKLSKETGLDALIRPLINALFKVIDKVADDPLNTLVEYLPQIAYTVDSGVLDTSVKAALSTSSILGGLAGSLDLSGSGLNTMITEKPLSIALDDTTSIEIKLNPIDWHTLGGCATAYRGDSVLSTGKYAMMLKSDVAPAFATIYYYLYDTIFEDSNYKSIKDGIRSAMPLESIIITGFTDVLKSLGSVKSLGLILDMTNIGNTVENKNNNSNGSGNGEISNNNDKNNANGNDESDNDKNNVTGGNADKQETDKILGQPSVPVTGAGKTVSTTVALALAISAVITFIKTRKDD